MALETFKKNKSASLLGIGVLSGILAIGIIILPLGFVGGWLTAVLWPVCFIGLVLGGIGTWAKSRKSGNSLPS